MILHPKLRKEIKFYEYDNSTFHMHDELSNKHFNIGKKQKEWLELFDGVRSIEDIESLIPKEYFEQFMEYVKEYRLLEGAKLEKSRTNIFKIKIRLGNIDNFLDRTRKFGTWYSAFINKTFFILLIINSFLLYGNISEIASNINLIFNSPVRLMVLIIAYVMIFISGILHEFSHAFVAKANNVSVPNIGIMMFYFNPAFYVDLSGINMLENKNNKINILAAGLKMNNILLFVTVVLWKIMEIKILKLVFSIYILSNLMVMLINIIPFVEFDGYYIYSEFLNSKNLKETTITQMNYLRTKEFKKVQIHYIVYFIYSLLFSSAFIVLGITSIMNIINYIVLVPSYFVILFIFLALIININSQTKQIITRKVIK